MAQENMIDIFSDELEFDSESIIEKKYEVKSLQFVHNWAHQRVCLIQHYFNISLIDDEAKKFCVSCFFDIVANYDIDIDGFQVSQHITDYAVELGNDTFTCYACESSLFTYCLTRFCILCNNI